MLWDVCKNYFGHFIKMKEGVDEGVGHTNGHGPSHRQAKLDYSTAKFEQLCDDKDLPVRCFCKEFRVYVCKNCFDKSSKSRQYTQNEERYLQNINVEEVAVVIKSRHRNTLKNHKHVIIQ